MINIIITGGAGFLGKNLIIELINNFNSEVNVFKNLIHKFYKPPAECVNIICIDNFISSSKEEWDYFIQEIQKNHNLKGDSKKCRGSKLGIELIDKDLCLISFEDFKKYKKIDEIYHFASIASPVFYKKYPMETLNVGYIGTTNILNIARIFKSKILLTSTSEVYGDPLIHPQNEKYYGNVNTVGERSCYDISKRISETLFHTYNKEYNVDTKIARLFNTFGEYMNLQDGRIITEVIKHLIDNTTLTIYGDGTQTRSCIYVKDTIFMLLKLMKTNYHNPINIGNNIETTVLKLVDIVEKEWSDISGIETYVDKQYINLTQNDPLKRKPCLELNRKILGIREFTSIEKGVRNTILFFQPTK